jgi:hypothetical protein
MKHTLPILIAVLGGAIDVSSAAAQTAPSAPAAGQELLAQAAQNLYRQPALSTKIRQRVQMFGEELVGSGAYLQLGDGPDKMLRLELKLQLAGRVSSLQQVSNGVHLWTRREVLNTKTLSFVDLEQIRRELAKARQNRPIDYAADWIVLGGLPALLKGLDENFEFAAAQAATFHGLPVWVLEGTWKPTELAKLLPEQQEAILARRAVDTRPLPPEIPDHVRLTLGVNDLFPYQLEFRRSRPADEAGQKTVYEPMLTMELFEVQFGPQLDPLQFQYKPGTQDVADHTELYLRKFGLPGGKVAERAGEPRR